ncbi:hypothetical protein MINTMi27_15650 [Mycobacterium intracellulare]|uniref:hypothetical protein n=1 Tax=Mycobacterium intracellulare TaxID=1767 RepID=UPI001925885E|nr:hypothetical protein [Mycobacterium intracellulare]BCP41472.1 hypothetical protein MINTMi27_15650 [Mycobacterium intracellulare]
MNRYYFWAIRPQANQVVSAMTYLTGYNTAVDGRPAARMFAEAENIHGETIEVLAGGADLERNYVPEPLSANFVMPEGYVILRIGVLIDPEAFAKGVVYFNFFNNLKVHPLVHGHLLDDSLSSLV